MPELRAELNRLSEALNRVVVGQSQLVQQLLVAMLAGGHVILEGVPGTGKTLLVKAIAQLIQAEFRRVQLTPDVLPADITGKSFQVQRSPDRPSSPVSIRYGRGLRAR